MPRQCSELQVKLIKNKRKDTLKPRQNVSIGYSPDEEEIERAPTSTGLKELVMNAANSGNPAVQLTAVQRCRKLLSQQENPPIDEVIDTGILPILIECLSRTDNPTLQYESAWALANIASGNSAQINKLVDAGAIPALLQLLKSPLINICELTLWALGIIIDDGPVLRDFVIEQGLVNILLSFIRANTPILVLSHVVWVIRNLCRSTDPPPPVNVIQEILPSLNTLIMHNNTDILTDIAWTISYLADKDKDLVQMVVESGIVPKLIPLLSHKEVKVQTAALTAVSNIVTGTEKQAQVVLNCGALFYFPALLSHQKKKINVLAVRFLSNILDGNEQQVQAVIDAGLLPNIVEKLAKDELESQRHAVQAVTNLCKKGTKEQVAALINCGVMPNFCNLLSCKNTEFIDILVGIVQALNLLAIGDKGQIQMIIESGIVPKLILLLSHKEVRVQTAAVKAVSNIVTGTEEHKQVVLDHGALSHIPALLSHQETEICKEAVRFLVNILSGNEQQVQEVIDAGLLPNIMEKLAKNELESQRHAVQAVTNLCKKATKEQVAALIDCGIVTALNNLLDCKNMEADILQNIVITVGHIIHRSVDRTRVMKMILESGIVPKLMPLLSHEELKVQIGALTTLGNIASGTEEHKQVVLDCGALSHIPALLSHQDQEICEQALWLVGNLINKNEERVQAVIEAGLLPKIVERLSKGELQKQKQAVRVIAKLSNGGTKEQIAVITDCGVMPALSNLLSCKVTEHIDILADIVWTVSHITYHSVDGIMEIIESGVVPKLIPLLSHKKVIIQTNALKAIVNIASGTKEHKQVVLDCGALSHIPALLSHQKNELCIQALRFLGNILLGNEKHVQAVIDAGLLPMIVKQVAKPTLQTQRLAAWALANLSSAGTKEQVAALIDCDVIPALCRLLNYDTKVVNNVLEFLYKMLEKAGENAEQLADSIAECGGLDKIKELQIQENVNIRNKANMIVEQCCAGDVMRGRRDKLINNKRDETRQMRRKISISHYTTNDIKELVACAVNADESAVQEDAVRECYKLLFWIKNYPTDEMIATCINIPVVCLSRATNRRIQYATVEVLEMITSRHSALNNKLVDAGAVPALLQLLNSPHKNICQKALIVLANIINDGPVLRDVVIEQGLVKSLLSVINPSVPGYVLRNVTLVIRNLCSSNDPPPPDKAIQEIISSLNSLVVYNNTHILDCILSAIIDLTFVCNDCIDRIQMLIKSGIVPKLIPLLSHKVMKVRIDALTAIVNIASGTKEQLQVVLNCGALSHIPALLSHQNKETCRLAVSFLANIFDGNEQQVQAVIDAGLLPNIVEKLNKGELETQRQALRAVTNFSKRGNKKQVVALIDCDVIPLMYNLLSYEDTEVINNVLESLSNMLEKTKENARQLADGIAECDGLDKIKQLQSHDNAEIHEKANNILKQYEDVNAMRGRSDKLINNKSDETRQMQGKISISHCTTTDLKQLAACAVNSDKPAVQLAAVKKCSKFLFWEKSRPTDEMIATCINIFVQYLSRAANRRIQYLTVEALENITSRHSALNNKVVDAGAVPALLQLLNSPHKNICQKALIVLANIINDGPVLRDVVIEQGLVKSLLSVINPNVPGYVLRNVTLVIRNLCSSKDPPPPDKAIQEIISSLNSLMMYNNTHILDCILCAIIDLTFVCNDCIQMLIKSGIVPKLIPLLSHKVMKVRIDALTAIGNISCGTKEQIQVVLDCGVLSYIPALLSHQNKETCRLAVSFLANIFNGNEQHVQAVIDAGLLPNIVEKLDKGGLKKQRQALRAVTNLSAKGNKKQVAALIDCDVIPLMCNLLSYEDTEVINNVLESLSNMLEKAEENARKLADSIAKCGGLDKLKELQSHDNAEIHEKANNILKQYEDVNKMHKQKDKLINNKRKNIRQRQHNVSISRCTDEEKIKRTRASTDLKELVMYAANSDNPIVQLAAVRQCSGLLSCRESPPTDEIIATCILPILVQCSSIADNPTLQYETAQVLANITRGNSALINKAVDASAVPALLQLLNSPHENVCEEALLALSNIIKNGTVLRDAVIEYGFVKQLLSSIKPNVPVPVLRRVGRVILNLCKCKDPPLPVTAFREILSSLNVLVLHSNTNVLEDVLDILAEAGNNQIQVVIESGIVPKLIALLSHKEAQVQRGALKAIGNIATGTEEQIQVVLNCGALSHFPALLSHQRNYIGELAVQFLESILAKSERQVQAVIDAGLLPKIVEKLANAEFNTQKGVLRIVTNLSRKSTKGQVAALIDWGVIPPLCNLLSCDSTGVIKNVLKSLSNMLMKAGENARQLSDSIAECGGLDKLKQLQSHDNAEIHKKANNILKQYEDFDVEGPAPKRARRS